jgi:hypothetical protein
MGYAVETCWVSLVTLGLLAGRTQMGRVKEGLLLSSLLYKWDIPCGSFCASVSRHRTRGVAVWMASVRYCRELGSRWLWRWSVGRQMPWPLVQRVSGLTLAGRRLATGFPNPSVTLVTRGIAEEPGTLLVRARTRDIPSDVDNAALGVVWF